MSDNDLKDNAILAITIVLVVAILATILLLSQSMRNERAATVVPDTFTMSFVAPDGYKCYVETADGAEPNLMMVYCKP